jgi:hypothetical protein
VFRACEISGVFCVDRAVHKLDFRLIINETSNGDEWKGHRVIGIQAFDRLCTFSSDRRRELINGFYPRS